MHSHSHSHAGTPQVDLTAQTTVADISATRPRAVKVFHQYGIDFCCGGRKPLAEACAEKGLDPQVLLQEIELLHAVGDTGVRWDLEPVASLIDHIIEHHHRPLDTELPRIEAMARRVYAVHGHRDPEKFATLLNTFLALRDELVPHMRKEEEVLFPWLRAGRGRDAQAPIRSMLYDHETVAGLLRQLRAVTDDYEVPVGACGTWTALWHGLSDLELDLHQHIHLENNVLFPRALQEG